MACGERCDCERSGHDGWEGSLYLCLICFLASPLPLFVSFLGLCWHLFVAIARSLLYLDNLSVRLHVLCNRALIVWILIASPWLQWLLMRPSRSAFPRHNSRSPITVLVVVTLLIPPLAATNDTSDSFRLIRVCGHALLLPRLVFDNPNPVHRGRDERPDHSTGSYAPSESQ